MVIPNISNADYQGKKEEEEEENKKLGSSASQIYIGLCFVLFCFANIFVEHQ